MRKLAVCLGLVAASAWVPGALAATGAIAYSDADGSLYLASLPGTNAKTLSDAGVAPALEALAVSPDGDDVLALETGDEPQLVLVPAAGGAPAGVRGTEGADAGAFSPDGATLVFSVDGLSSGGLAAGLYTVGVGGGTPKPVLATPDGDVDSLPQYSPDGSRLAFVRDAVDSRGEEAASLELVPVTGGTPKALATGLAPDVYDGGRLSFSPDGALIAYAGDYDDPGIYVVPAAGGDPVALTSDLDSWPSFAADGSTVFFSRDASSDNARATTVDDVYELWTVAKDGTGAIALAEGDFEDLAVRPAAPPAAGQAGSSGGAAAPSSSAAPAKGSSAAAPAKAAAGKGAATAVRVRAKGSRYIVRWSGRAPAWKVTLRVGRRFATAKVKGSVHSHTFLLRGAKGAITAAVRAA